MNSSNFCKEQRQKENQQSRQIILFGVLGSMVLHIVLALAISVMPERTMVAEEAIELIIVEETELEKPQPKEEIKETELEKPQPKKLEIKPEEVKPQQAKITPIKPKIANLPDVPTTQQAITSPTTIKISQPPIPNNPIPNKVSEIPEVKTPPTPAVTNINKNLPNTITEQQTNQPLIAKTNANPTPNPTSEITAINENITPPNPVVNNINENLPNTITNNSINNSEIIAKSQVNSVNPIRNSDTPIINESGNIASSGRLSIPQKNLPTSINETTNSNNQGIISSSNSSLRTSSNNSSNTPVINESAVISSSGRVSNIAKNLPTNINQSSVNNGTNLTGQSARVNGVNNQNQNLQEVAALGGEIGGDRLTNQPPSKGQTEKGIECIRECRPSYPSVLNGLEGNASVQLGVDSQGNVTSVTLSKANQHSEINQQALLAAKKMKFRPPSTGNNVLVTVNINFTVAGSEFDRIARQQREEQERSRQAQLEKEKQERQARLEQERQERQRQLEVEPQQRALDL